MWEEVQKNPVQKDLVHRYDHCVVSRRNKTLHNARRCNGRRRGRTRRELALFLVWGMQRRRANSSLVVPCFRQAKMRHLNLARIVRLLSSRRGDFLEHSWK